MTNRRPPPRTALAVLGLVVVAAYLSALAQAAVRRPDLSLGPPGAFPTVTAQVVLAAPQSLIRPPSLATANLTHPTAPTITGLSAGGKAVVIALVTSADRRGHVERGPPVASRIR
jgi:hypothetical protein